MSDVLVVGAVVEGHGEVTALPTLLHRLAGARALLVLPPIRLPRGSMRDESKLENALRLCRAKLRGRTAAGGRSWILLLADSDGDLPCQLGPELQGRCRASSREVSCVVAHFEFETWFVAGAEGLLEFVEVEGLPEDPEGAGARKAWLEQRWRRGKYRETVDQKKLAASFDLEAARRRSPSFRKLCRDFERAFSS